MLFTNVESGCVLHYDKIAQTNFLTDPIIKAIKIPNFETKNLSYFEPSEAKLSALYLFG